MRRLTSNLIRLAVCGLTFSACAPATVVAPTAPPTEPAKPTAPPNPTSPPEDTPAEPGSVEDPGVPATSFMLANPTDIAFDTDGNLYATECGGTAPDLIKVDPYGQLTTYSASRGGFSGDGGPVLESLVNCPAGLAFDGDGNLYIADLGNHRIRRVDRNGIISTVAGSGPANWAEGAFAGDGGPATSAQLNLPTDVVVDASGNLYIADAGNERIRKVDRQGVITTIAGNGTRGFAGDDGLATDAQLNLDTGNLRAYSGIALDADGNLYIADGSNQRVRMIDRRGIITTIAGTDGSTPAGDGGPATAAVLSNPTGLAFDADGNLYVATGFGLSISDHRIRKIDKDGIITTVAGAGEPGFGGNGVAAVSAYLRQPQGIAFDDRGSLYIADGGNQRIRRIERGIIYTVAGGNP